ncbi:hypothetical protein AB0M39_26995 [Streptomyces sp. NPDC051907]|uniref:hypothetical protein n=1 Tax=Streptomyces sp. NPDC051907 TaxID=3155284 RepID=UPI00342D34DF
MRRLRHTAVALLSAALLTAGMGGTSAAATGELPYGGECGKRTSPEGPAAPTASATRISQNDKYALWRVTVTVAPGSGTKYVCMVHHAAWSGLAFQIVEPDAQGVAVYEVKTYMNDDRRNFWGMNSSLKNGPRSNIVDVPGPQRRPVGERSIAGR